MPTDTSNLRYEDRPDLLETFVDTAHRMTFDGRTLRIEFCVNRWEDPGPDGARTGRSVPISRMVLDLDGAVDLFNKINSLQSVLESRGVIRKTAPPAAAAEPPAAEPATSEPAAPPAKAKAPARK
ncbi:MAG TPA: hypothetical protein VG939_21090 [Caulobacteraceae bacterium]|nr:hypothetical protein [Caulobacteraceae bacterium]